MKHGLQSTRRAFTLIEVLMAMFILAIGLLSLAAVFPAGIEVQRRGADDIEAVRLADTVRGLLLGDPELNSDRLNEGWSGLLSTSANSALEARDWIVSPKLEGSFGADDEPIRYDTDGALTITYRFDPANPGYAHPTYDSELVIPAAQRLWPSASDPRMIWDLIVRRPKDPGLGFAPTAVRMSSPVQLLIVVRRVDPGFRVDSGKPPIVDPFDPGAGYAMPVLLDETTLDLEYDETVVDDELRMTWRNYSSGGDGAKLLAALQDAPQMLIDPDGAAWRLARVRERNDDIYMQFTRRLTIEQGEWLSGDGGAQPELLFYRYGAPVYVDAITIEPGEG
jgi:prepilin-type N-terminal cleavage/methylation domain-containing protein